MIHDVFTAAIYTPLYNALIFLISHVPYGDVGFAIIILTIVVKIILLPVTKKATHTQLMIKRVAPKLEEIKNIHKDNQQEQVKHMLKLYKEHQINPLSGIITIFVQIPIIFGLYRVFLSGGLPVIDPTHLYSFVVVPTVVNMQFLGFLDLSARSVVLAVLAGATQFVIAKITFEPPAANMKPGESLKEDVMRSLHLQTKYMLPLVVGAFAYFLSAAVALHWVVGNTFTLVQDIIIRRNFTNTISN